MSPRRSAPREITISTATFAKAGLILLGLVLLWFIRDIVAMVLVAMLLAALINPVADWFARYRVPRGVTVVMVYAVLLAICIIVAWLLVPAVREQFLQVLVNFDASYRQFVEQINRWQISAAEWGLAENLESTIAAGEQWVSNSLDSIFSRVWGVVGALLAVIITLVLAFYMVVEENAVRTFFRNLAPKQHQARLVQLVTRMEEKIGAWMRGQLILGVIIGLAVYIGLTVLGVPYALLLAILAGLLEVVPYIGPIIALIPAVIIGFATSPLKGILVLVLYLVIQQLENNVLVPKIMQKVTGLNPIVSLLALLIGLKVAGIAGAVLAIPLATMGAVVLEEFMSEPS